MCAAWVVVPVITRGCGAWWTRGCAGWNVVPGWTRGCGAWYIRGRWYLAGLSMVP